MAAARIISGIVLLCCAVKANPDRPNWTRPIVLTIFWPLSLFGQRGSMK